MSSLRPRKRSKNHEKPDDDDRSLSAYDDVHGYFRKKTHENMAVYDVFFRKGAGESKYAVFAGLEQVIEYINNLHFQMRISTICAR